MVPAEDDDELEEPVPEPASRGNCRRSCVLTALLVSGLVGVSAYSLDATRDQRVANAVREVEEAGLQVSDLHLVPDGPNGADDLELAANAFDTGSTYEVYVLGGVDPVTLSKALKDPSSKGGQRLYMPEDPQSPATLKEALTLFVAAVDQITPQIEAGLSKEVGWAVEFEVKGSKGCDAIGIVDELIKVLSVRSGVRMLEGNSAGAYADLELCLALAKTLTIPTSFTRYLRNRGLDRCLFLFEGLLALGPPPPPEQRARILGNLRAFKTDFGLTQALLGDLHEARLLADAPPPASFPKEHPGPRARLLYGSWRASHVEVLAKCVLASRQPPQEFRRFLASLRQEEGAGPYRETVVSTFHVFERKNREALTRLRLAIRGIELLDLPQLPQSLSDMPFDACLFDKRRCNYRLDAERAVLWSVGPDKIDQAGVPAWDSDGATDDYPFRIPRPKR